jgi:hypothetical protein
VVLKQENQIGCACDKQEQFQTVVGNRALHFGQQHYSIEASSFSAFKLPAVGTRLTAQSSTAHSIEI